MAVAWRGAHVLSTGDVQLWLHVLPTLLVALVQNVLPHVKGVLEHLCQAWTEVAAGTRRCCLLSS